MDEKTKQKFDALFDAQHKRDADRDHAKEQLQSAEDRFAAEFQRLSRDVVEPALEELKGYLAGQGIVAEIERAGAPGQPPRSPSTSFKLISGTPRLDGHPGRTMEPRAVHNTPHVTFSAYVSKQKVSTSESTIARVGGGQSGSTGEYRLQEITPEFVSAKVLATLEKFFG